MSSRSPSTKVQNLCERLKLNDEVLKRYMATFNKEMKNGLRGQKSSMKCLLTCIHDIPTGHGKSSFSVPNLPNFFLLTTKKWKLLYRGVIQFVLVFYTETGSYVVLSVAGVSIKVTLVNLKKMRYDLRAKEYSVPPGLPLSTGEKLFDFFADCVYDLTSKCKVSNKNLPLCFVFGFPFKQKGIKSGVLIEWTKGFSCPDVVGKDVVQYLERSLDKIHDLEVHVSALLNDSVGTLLSCAWKNHQCHIGMILDVGTNVCYLEKTENVTEFEGDSSKDKIIINTEYGNLGSGGDIDFLRTEWDKDLDKVTINPRKNVCEKMMSSLYLGEIVRRVLVTAVRKGIILGGKVSQEISTVGSFRIAYLVDIITELRRQRTVRDVLKKMGYEMPWAQDCVDVEYVCLMVWRRAGLLAAASLAALISRMEDRKIVVALEGIFARSHRDFLDLIRKKITDLLDPKRKFQLYLEGDGCGLGAALVASMRNKSTDQRSQNDDFRETRGSFFDNFRPSGILENLSKSRKRSRSFFESWRRLSRRKTKTGESIINNPELRTNSDSQTVEGKKDTRNSQREETSKSTKDESDFGRKSNIEDLLADRTEETKGKHRRLTQDKKLTRKSQRRDSGNSLEDESDFAGKSNMDDKSANITELHNRTALQSTQDKNETRKSRQASSKTSKNENDFKMKSNGEDTLKNKTEIRNKTLSPPSKDKEITRKIQIIESKDEGDFATKSNREDELVDGTEQHNRKHSRPTQDLKATRKSETMESTRSSKGGSVLQVTQDQNVTPKSQRLEKSNSSKEGDLMIMSEKKSISRSEGTDKSKSFNVKMEKPEGTKNEYLASSSKTETNSVDKQSTTVSNRRSTTTYSQNTPKLSGATLSRKSVERPESVGVRKSINDDLKKQKGK